MTLKYPKQLKFQCLGCSVCCGDTEKRIRHILLLEREARNISETTALRVVDFAARVHGKSPYVYEIKKNVQNGKCLFLQENRCRIYPLRPLVCRFYPFEMKSSKEGDIRFLSTTECPGIGRGKRLTKKHFEDLHMEARTQLTR